MLRRALLLAPMLVLLWIGTASAQEGPDYTIPPTVVPSSSSSVPPGTVPPEVEDEDDVEVTGSPGRDAGDLARTGADNIGPLIQAAIVLLGGGTLLVLVARRRRAQRRASA